MSERGFFSRILGGGADEDETRVFSAEEIGTRRPTRREEEPDEEEQRPQGFTVERAAEVIDDLPPDVPRESAVRIVRGTLTAAGIKVEDLERSTRVRESKLNSEMDLARDRQQEIQQRTEEAVRSLEEEIRKAREDRDAGIAGEEERISRASAGIEGIKRVRAFFGFPSREKRRLTVWRRIHRWTRRRSSNPSTRTKPRSCAVPRWLVWTSLPTRRPPKALRRTATPAARPTNVEHPAPPGASRPGLRL